MAPSQLTLEKITLEDVPAMIDIWFAAFTRPHVRKAMPDTPGVRKWFADCTINDITEHPHQTYLKIVDLESNYNEGNPRMVAWGKWDSSMPDERGPRFFLPWTEEMDSDFCSLVFDAFDKNRKKVMGDEKHVCKHHSAQCNEKILVLIVIEFWIRCVRILIIGDGVLGR